MTKLERMAQADKHLDILRIGKYTTLYQGKPKEVVIGDIPKAELVTSEELDILNFPEKSLGDLKMEVTNNSAITDIVRCSRGDTTDKIGVLNFASSYSPGGGFISGAIAQEEALCHASTLYVQLENCKLLYQLNKRAHSSTYTDHMAISKTKFIRNGEGLLIPNPVDTLVVTSAAVNVNRVRIAERDKVPEVMRQRMHKIIQLFIREGCNILILGAFGCGVFSNDPYLIAQIWKDELDKYGGYFDRLIFSIMCKNTKDSVNYQAFSKILLD